MEFDNLRKLMIAARSVRRFQQDKEIGYENLMKLLELVRYCPSGRNAQPLKYVVVDDVRKCAEIYPLLKWADYYQDWDGPEPGERPAAYLIQCLDTHYGTNCLCDDGLQLEALTLGLAAMKLSGCIIKVFDPKGVSEVLSLSERFVPRYVLAIGYPAENVVLEDMNGDEDADFKYYRTPDEVHHVPKRPLRELICRQAT